MIISSETNRIANIIQGVSFQYIIDYDYNRRYSCKDYGCHSEGICRCSKIVDVSITTTSIDLNSISNQVSKSIGKVSKEEFMQYCLYRLLIIFKAYDSSNYEVIVGNDYYGEEVKSVNFNSPTVNVSNEKYTLGKAIGQLVQYNPSDRIRLVLKLEYGYLLDKLKAVDFKQETVRFDQLKCETGQDSYVRKNYGNAYDETYTLPIGIYEHRDGDTLKNSIFKVIDGNHRYMTFSNLKPKSVDIIYFYPEK